MSELDDLQQLWQRQSTAQPIPDPEQTLAGIRQFHEKVRRERRGMTISFVFTLLFLSSTFWMYREPLYIIGILIIFVAMFFLMALMWKNRLRMEGSSFELSNQAFLSANIEFIQKRRAITTRYMPIYAFLLILGINIGYIDLLQLMDLGPLARIGIHLGLSLLMVVFFRIGVRKHLEKLDRQLAPLLASLKGAM
jgi:hypothetical protein